MNIFDLRAWRMTNIRSTYHAWLKENLKSNLTMWKLGTLPPALIAFKGHIQAIDPYWHMLGLGYQNNTKIENVQKAAVIHYNGQSKPWLQIGFEHLRPFWSKCWMSYQNPPRRFLDQLSENTNQTSWLWISSQLPSVFNIAFPAEGKFRG